MENESDNVKRMEVFGTLDREKVPLYNHFAETTKGDIRKCDNENQI
jgi:hypothetical protein